MVVPRFVEAALRGDPIPVFGSGEQTRAFVNVRDTVEAIHRLTQSAAAEPLVCNIGGDREITINRLADLVVAQTASKGGVAHLSYQQAYGMPIDDMMRRRPRIDRVRAALGAHWPHVTLEASLEEIIAELRAGLE